MNKKFLLLPLVAMTASVYASEPLIPEQDQIQQLEEYTKLTDNNTQIQAQHLTAIAANLDYDNEDSDLIKVIQEGSADTDPFYIYIKNSNQIQALNKLAEVIKNTTSLQEYNYFGDSTSALTTDQILTAIDMQLKEQQPEIELDQTTDTFKIHPGIKGGTRYNQLVKTQDAAQFTIETLHAKSNKIIPTEIKNIQKFLQELGSKTLNIKNNEEIATVQNKIIDLIKAENKQLQDYAQIRGVITNNQYLPTELKNKQFKLLEDGTPDPTSASVQLLNELTEAKKQLEAEKDKSKTSIKEKDEKIQELMQQLETEKNKIKKPEYDKPLAILFSQTAEKLQDKPSILVNEAQDLISQIYKSLPNQQRKQFEEPQLIKKVDKQKQTTTINTQLSKEERIKIKIAETKGTVGLPDIINEHKQITFGKNIQPTTITNFTKLYDAVAKETKQQNPTQWSNDAYIKAIGKIITKTTYKNFGLQLSQTGDFDGLLKDLKTFNSYQKTKFIYCYLNKETK